MSRLIETEPILARGKSLGLATGSVGGGAAGGSFASKTRSSK